VRTGLMRNNWVRWALQTLFTLPDAHPMAFKGGTSLSKVYGIIEGLMGDPGLPEEMCIKSNNLYKDDIG